MPEEGEGVGLGGEEVRIVGEVETAEVRDLGERGKEGFEGGGGEVAGGEVEGVKGGEFVERGGDDVDVVLRGGLEGVGKGRGLCIPGCHSHLYPGTRNTRSRSSSTSQLSLSRHLSTHYPLTPIFSSRL